MLRVSVRAGKELARLQHMLFLQEPWFKAISAKSSDDCREGLTHAIRCGPNSKSIVHLLGKMFLYFYAVYPAPSRYSCHMNVVIQSVISLILGTASQFSVLFGFALRNHSWQSQRCRDQAWASRVQGKHTAH